MKIERVKEISEINEDIKKIRDIKEGFVTNFFLNISLASLWIKYETLSKINIGKSLFLLRNDGTFEHLYFCSASKLHLVSDLNYLLEATKNKTIYIDILGTETQAKELASIFYPLEFNLYTTFVRMSKLQKGLSSLTSFTNSVKYAELEDLDYLRHALRTNFDKYSEQLPFDEELVKWINEGNILISKLREKHQGFLIFDDLGLTSYLRYWFVHPEFRENKIGSNLFKTFLNATSKAQRTLFWVNKANENACNRYLHYGFNYENFIDIILTNSKP